MVGDAATDEQRLIEQVVAGNRSAFDRLVGPQAHRLLALAQRMLGSSSEAEDAVQNALASVWLARHRLDPDRPIAAFLTTVTLNKCRDHLRRRKAARFLGLGLGSNDALAVDQAANPETATGDRQAIAQVQAEIERLPIRLREALILVAIDGRSQREGADLLGVTEKTVEMRIYRARQRLRKKITFP